MALLFRICFKMSCLILWFINYWPQELHGQNNSPTEKVIRGLDFGILPSLVYNTDKGLQYGALANFYYYGQGTVYPDYLFNLYLQSSQTTKKGYVDYLFFDSGHLLPKGLRCTVDLSLQKRGYQQFYGFNGYDALYNPDFINRTKPDFRSRHYYYFDEKTHTVAVDLRGNFPVANMQWDIGVGNYLVSARPFRNWAARAPKETTLFEKYINEGVIPPGQRNGGATFFLKAGLMYDTRDNEAIPTKGIWAEGVYINAPDRFNRFAYSQASVIFHQYIRLGTTLVFAYRLAFQTRLSGQIPFYVAELASTYRSQEALGGNKTIRGVLTRRLIGNGFALANWELRYVPFHTVLLNRNLAVGFNVFHDMGIVTQKYRIDPSLNARAFDYQPGHETWHRSVGAGIRFIVNHNFIVAFDYGRALDKRDGTKALYIGLDYLF